MPPILERVRGWCLRNPETLALGATLLAIELVYLFVVSAGTFTSWPTQNSYYDLQAEGFRAGQLAIAAAPAPELLRAPNPFIREVSHLWMGDVSLYRGRYFLYWGPLPALLQALAKSALRIDRLIGDQYLVFAFLSLSAWAGALLLRRLARRLFPGLPLSLLVAAILTLALANPVLHTLASAGVYQAALSGGQAFMLLGLLFAFDGVWREDPWRGRRALAAAGCTWALALGCRVSLAPAAVLLAALAALAAAWSQDRRWRQAWLNLCCAGLPLAVGMAALLCYNRARFDAWLEFGTRLQLAHLPFRFSVRHFAANIYSYLLRPLAWTCQFPYREAIWHMGSGAFPAWVPLSRGYLVNEPVAGLLRAVPSVWLAPVALAGAVQALRQLLAGARGAAGRGREEIARLWCAASFLTMGTLTGALALGLYMATMRYLLDVTFGLVLLGVLGSWLLWSRTRGRVVAHRLARALSLTTAAATVLFGLLLGYSGYHEHFQRRNPALHQRIVTALSVCTERSR